MWNMLWPIIMVVTANTIYNISAKSTPQNINLFASLSASYLIAMICAVIMFFITSEQKNLIIELSKAGWTTYALGGVCFYKETLTMRQWVGMLVCGAGLALIMK